MQPQQFTDLELFPILNQQPADVPQNPAAPIQRWRAPLPAGMTSVPPGMVAYAGIDPATAALTFYSIPAAQYYGCNMPNTAPGAPPQQVNQPPIDLVKYNALASENEKIVATPFGLLLESTVNTSAGPAPASTDSPLVQTMASQVAAIYQKFVTGSNG